MTMTHGAGVRSSRAPSRRGFAASASRSGITCSFGRPNRIRVLPLLWHFQPSEGTDTCQIYEPNQLPYSRLWDSDRLWYNSDMSHTDNYTVALGERGRIVLPAPLRRRLDLQPGDRLILIVDSNGGFRVVSARE